MVPLGLPAPSLARDIDVPPNRNHRDSLWRAITAGTAIRLGERFGTTAEFCLNLQSRMTRKPPACIGLARHRHAGKPPPA